MDLEVLLDTWGIHSPVCSPRRQARDGVHDDLCEKFNELFQELFLEKAVELHTDLLTAKGFLLKDFTPAMRETMKDRIPRFVDDEFGDDLLALSMPVLGAALRMIYQAQIDAQVGSDEGWHDEDWHDTDSYSTEESDEEDSKRRVPEIDRKRVVDLLNDVVREYIVDFEDGVEVVGRIVSKRLRGLAGK